MIVRLVLAALAFVMLASNAEARIVACIETGSTMHPVCMWSHVDNPFSGAVKIRVTMHRVKRSSAVGAIDDGQVLPHPTSCPARAFCGCGASIRIFGKSIRELWLAANWLKFPRTAPAPGMAAVRRHHVMVLEADLGNGIWRVFDANAGHHLTLLHARSIAGYRIVNPHG